MVMQAGPVSSEMAHAPLPFRLRALAVLWPAFLMAGVLEMLVFAVVDPQQLHWFGAEPIDWPSGAVYTLSFFMFWGVIATSGALTQLLELPPSGAGSAELPADAGREP